jgi:hypothetical protein
VSQVRKNWARRKNIVFFHLKLISKRLSRKVGEANTVQGGQREKHRHRGKEYNINYPSEFLNSSLLSK